MNVLSYPNLIYEMRGENHYDKASGNKKKYLMQTAYRLGNPLIVFFLVGVSCRTPKWYSNDGENHHRETEVTIGYLIWRYHFGRKMVRNHYIGSGKENDSGNLQNEEFNSDVKQFTDGLKIK